MLDKMLITTRLEKYVESSENYVSFYTNYAFVVFNTLRRPLFQRFLNWMLRKERIEEREVKDVQIRMFPFIKENGNGLAGKCNSRGEIRLYPKQLEFFREKMQEFEKENVNFYIKSRAMASLIHELLHLKYVSNEGKVRKLTEKYFNIFTKHQRVQNLDAKNITKMIFT